MRKSRPGGLPLRGARVLITGAGGGVGRQLALDSAQRGASEVVLWNRSEERARAVAAELEAKGAKASVHVVDVADRAAVAAAAAATGVVDILINNAGVVTGAPLLEAGDDDIVHTYEVNTLALYWTTRAFLPAMLQRDRGVIVNHASAAGLVGVARQTDYSGSKFAAFGFTESLRSELRAAGSRVSTLVVAPYYIDTGMFDGVRTRFPLLLPILKTEDVSRRILDAVEAGDQQLIMPLLTRFVPALRILPVRAFDWVLDFFGVTRSMDHFTGRARRRR